MRGHVRSEESGKQSVSAMGYISVKRKDVLVSALHFALASYIMLSQMQN